MKTTFCKKRKCLRLRENGTHLWDIPLCQDRLSSWFEPVESITNEQCQRLRRMLKEKKDVQI